MSTEIIVQLAREKMDCPESRLLQAWAQMALSDNAQSGELCLRIVDTNEITALNQQFRHKNKPTNVLAFPYDPIEDVIPAPIGDIVLCADVINEEAKTQHKKPQAHWAHMVIHGCLHLQGFDHIEPADASIMEQREIELLAELGFNNPYGESNTHER